jgi:uncharacterized membrane protein
MSPIWIALRQWRQQWLWLLIWTILGAGLRFTNLDGKPPWADEFRTLVLSIGNSFKLVPLDRVIDIQTLLAPLIPNPHATFGEIIDRVSIEDRQPPIYFGLAHLWMQLFPTDGGLVKIWAARALPAIFGTLAIPIGYICSYLTFGTQPEARPKARSIANFTAAMLAISPYGVFIAQEARHYSLAIWWVIISINCLAIACRQIANRQNLPLRIVAIWVSANILGMGTHYLFGIALIAQVMTLGIVWRWQARQIPQAESALMLERKVLPLRWRRLAVAILSTAAGAAFWLWWLANSVDRTMPGWIDNAPHKLIEVINPAFQILGAAISMMSLLLVEVTELPPIGSSDDPIDPNIPIVILSAILMLVFFVWVIPMLDRGVRSQFRSPFKVETLAILWFTTISLGLYVTVPWLTGIDITRGARYHFVYFPGMMMLVGIGLASCWQTKPSIAKWVSGKQAVTIVICMGVVSSAIVANNYGYHKYYRPEQIVPMIQQSAPLPVLIATTHNSLVQVGEMMGLAWEMQQPQRQELEPKTQFLLARQAQKFCERDCAATKLLSEIVDRQSHSIDLWLINFNAPVNLPPTCDRSKQFTRGVYGYKYQLYHCRQSIDDRTS